MSAPRSLVSALLILAAGLPALSVPASGQGLTIIAIRDDRVAPPPTPRPFRPAPVEIRSQSLTTEIRSGVAMTTIRQTFHNPNPWIAEGEYVFPLPEGASVSDFVMDMGGKKVHGEVLDSGKAREIYESIVRRTRDPGLLEYAGLRLFRARVFPIPAQGALEIALSFTATLESSSGLLRFTHPLRAAAGPGAAIGTLSIDIRIQSDVPLRTLYSPSHAVDVVKKGDREARVTFEGKDVRPDRDFLLYIGRSENAVGLGLLTWRTAAEPGWFLMSIAPGESAGRTEVLEKDVVFVFDTSGSMSGDKMEQARRAMAFCLRNLARGDRFALIPFSTDARPWRDGLTPATSEAVEAAVAHVHEQRAAGGTNIHGALSAAMAARREGGDRLFLVIFMTDGLPTIGVTEPAEILKSVKTAAPPSTRLFVFGVGHDVNTVLLDRLADDNGGARDYVQEKEDIEVKVSDFFTKVSSPVLSDVALEVDGVRISDVHPRRLPDLFRGSELVLFGRYEGEGARAIRLRGRVNGREVVHTFEGTFPRESRENDFIPRLWAVRRTAFLMDEIRLRGENAELRDEIVRLGKRWGIVTPYTSFLVVEDAPVAGGFRVPPASATPAWRRPGGGGGAERGDADERAEEAFLGTGGGWRRVGAPAPGGPPADGGDAKKEREVQKSLRTRQLGDAKNEGEVNRPAADGSTLLPRRAGDRTFVFRDGLWVDPAYLDMDDAVRDRDLTRVRAFSEDYFALLRERPALRTFFAVGEAVIVVFEGRVYRVDPAE